MILTCERHGNNKVYRLRDEHTGNIAEERISKRDYVACSNDGNVWYVDRRLAEKDDRDLRRRNVVFLTEKG